MTAVEWLVCIDPEMMLEFLSGKASERKARLLGAAWCRCVSSLLGSEIGHLAIVAAERYADGLASTQELAELSDRILEAYPRPFSSNELAGEPTLRDKAESIALQSTWFLLRQHDNFLSDCCRCTYLGLVRAGLMRALPNEQVDVYGDAMLRQCMMIREVFGNPYHSVEAAPSSKSSTVLCLASAIYDDCGFDRVPILADALEDAGCTNADILAHCRQPGEHVRGCWVVDLLLGKQ